MAIPESDGRIPADDANRNDFERLDCPPYEKDILELGGRCNSDDNEEAIHMYRCGEGPRRYELQIRASFQIIYAMTGSCTVTIQGKPAKIPERGIMFLTQGTPHLLDIPRGARILDVIIPTSVLKRSFNIIVEYQSPVSSFISNSLWGDIANAYMLFHKSSNGYIYSLFDMLISEECYPTGASEMIKNFLLMSMIGYLSSYTPTDFDMSSIRMTRSDQIPKILNFINDNYRTVTLEKLAENFHYTIPYVSKLIRCATGMTFTAILRETKFDVCRSLLTNSELKINRIAEIAGFQNTDHFNRIFKKRMGVTPSDFKKNRDSAGIDKAR